MNGWALFLLVTLLLCVMMSYQTWASDFSSGQDVASLVGFSVRWAVPFIYIVVAASAVRKLFPGRFSGWWFRNRKHFGLCFAVVMAWQAVFIYILSQTYRDYYYDEIYLLRDELEGSVGYIFLIVMVITTFPIVKRAIDFRQWKLLHTSGIYFLWAYPFSVYWWAISYGYEQRLLDHFYYWAGFLAFALRIAAWGKRRHQQSSSASNISLAPMCLKVLGYFFIAAGIVAAATGEYWQESATAFMTQTDSLAHLVLWLPFWPFEPFYSLMILGLGTLLLTWQPK